MYNSVNIQYDNNVNFYDVTLSKALAYCKRREAMHDGQQAITL